MEVFQQHSDITAIKQAVCRCDKLTCIVNGDNIEISCDKCKKTMVIKTSGIEEAIETLVYKREPIILNLKR